jgi:hypothetical protein
MKTAAEILSELKQCIGTSKYIKSNIFPGLVFTDGVNTLRQSADAFWLVDAIASYKRKEPFQIWKLEVCKDKTAVLTMQEDTDEPFLVQQKIHYTDFPLDEIKLYVEEGGYGTMEKWTPCLVLMLPNER